MQSANSGFTDVFPFLSGNHNLNGLYVQNHHAITNGHRGHNDLVRIGHRLIGRNVDN